MTLNLFLSVIVLFCYWKYGKATVQLSSIWHSNCSCLVIVVCFAIENTVKQPFTCHQYDTQTVLVLLLFCFTIENTVLQPFSCPQYDSQTVLVLLFLFLYWYWKNNIWQFVDARCTIFVHDVLHLEKWTRPFSN